MGPIGYKNDCLVTLGISRKIETLTGWRVGLISLRNLRKALDLKVALEALE